MKLGKFGQSFFHFPFGKTAIKGSRAFATFGLPGNQSISDGGEPNLKQQIAPLTPGVALYHKRLGLPFLADLEIAQIAESDCLPHQYQYGRIFARNNAVCWMACSPKLSIGQACSAIPFRIGPRCVVLLPSPWPSPK